MNHTKFRVLTSATSRAFLLSLLALAGCSGSPLDNGSENVAATDQPLLAATCTTTGGNLALTVGDGDVAYIGRISGCTVEPCVYANAKDSSGNLCAVNSTGKTISVTGDGTAAHVEKVVFDFSNGLFAEATTASPLMTVALDGTGPTSASKVMIIPPLAGGNMALGVNGLVIDATSKRTPLHLDMTIAGVSSDPAPKFEFNGGAGADSFTGDVANVPAGFATTAALTPVAGAATSLNLTISGGAGADFIAGGAGTNTLLGGAGNDTFVQGTAVHAETIQGGDGVDTVDYSARTAPVFVTPNSDTGVTTVAVHASGGGTGYTVGDVLSLAGGTSGLLATVTVATVSSGAVATVTISNPGDGYAATGTSIASTAVTGTGSGATFDTTGAAANDGAATEGDSVASDVEIINGGSGNDVLNAHAVTVTDVVLIGNAGDDKLTGGGGNDDLCGGAGNDRFFENAGNDNLVGGAGTDTADYSTGTGVIACLNAADTAATKTCVTQNGATGEKDLVNGVLAKVCPRATLNVGLAAGGTAVVAPTTPGGAMAVDVENLTGNPTAANTLRCGTLACTVFGGTAADTIVGSPLADQIFGLGGDDTVTANGGNDLIDLTGSASATETVDCGGNPVTLLFGATPTENLTACTSANIP
ncbi:MAG TPA: calcium-binding protein [Polyangiaceae bacterium]|jgi:Ca2+-binding RTX toxin-like protein|nr:calcium-binding protein [Polyangiaceae bacterium]